MSPSASRRGSAREVWDGAVSTPFRRPAAESVRREPFGHSPGGEAVEQFTLASAGGIELRVMTYGAIIRSLRVPDRHGALGDIVLGHDGVGDYARSASYFGAVVGRFGNRIARGRFPLDGQDVQLVTNDGRNHLHGGRVGFDKVVWKAEPFSRDGARGIVLAHRSPDGDQGYPGTLDARVTYTLTDDAALLVEYEATADHATPVNLTQHTYFNLAGDAARDVLDHRLTIHATQYTPVDSELVPTGALAPVAGTPFDFRRPTRIGASIVATDEQLRHAGGYDHNFVLTSTGNGLAPAARLADPDSGRVLDISTTEPGLQFYSGNFLDGTVRGKGGRTYGHRTGLCLETQHFPDSPNRPHFPNTILRPGATYRSRTMFAFGVE